MPGTDTYGVINGTPAYKQLTLYTIDVSGDNYPVSFRLDAAALPADIETFAQAYQDMTQASVWRVDVQDVYRGIQDPSNAVNTPRESAQQGINMLFRDASFNAQSLRVAAPEDGLFVQNTDNIDNTDPKFGALATAYQAIVPGTPDWESASYSERKETNKRVKI